MSGFEILGVIGLVGPAISSCVSLCELWMQMEGTGQDVSIFKVRLDLQAARLKTWKLEWRIGAPDDLTKSHPLFTSYAPLAVRYLYLIHFILRDMQDLEAKFDFLKASTPTKRITQVVAFDATEEWVQIMRDAFQSVNQQAGVIGRLKWAFDTPRAAKKRLVVLKDLVDDLTNFFRAPEQLDLATAVLGTILQTKDRELVKTLGAYAEERKADDASDKAVEEEDEDMTDNERQVSALAWIKEEVSVMAERVAGPVPGAILPMTQLGAIKNDPQNNRATARFKGGDVFVEWKTIPSLKKNENSPIFDRRVREIAYLLRSIRKPSQFRTLDCLGLVRAIGPDTIKFGLVFKMESSRYFSLRDLFTAPGRKITLGDRFSAAITLARALLYLHLASWLHKAIRSDNIAYFAPSVESVDYKWPFLVGFDMSRPSRENEMTEVPQGNLRFNVYRHPRVQGIPVDVDRRAEQGDQTPEKAGLRDRFSALHDIYSFGIILLELAECRSIEDQCKVEKPECFDGEFKADKMKTWLVEEKVPALDTRMGTHYREATLLCLTGDFGETDQSLQMAFYLQVVRRLEKCSA